MPLIAVLIAALFGWEGKVHFTHNPPRKSGGSEGAIHVAPGRVRLEQPSPSGLTVVLWDGKKLRLLFPEKRTYLELPPQDAPLATAPPLSLDGMKQVGTEIIEGRTCLIYEIKYGDVTQRLWVPEGEAPASSLRPPAHKLQPPAQKRARRDFFLFLREATVTPRGATRADISDVKEGPQPAALFEVPHGYTRQ